jgi:hypothetical protein
MCPAMFLWFLGGIEVAAADKDLKHYHVVMMAEKGGV